MDVAFDIDALAGREKIVAAGFGELVFGCDHGFIWGEW
jgi:hypothetical protein